MERIMVEILTRSEKETEKLGEKLGKLLKPGTIILIKGDLGVGKTVLTRGIARGLGIDEPITSPTFTLLHQYKGRLPLYHFDIYRIGDPEEMYDIGYEEFFYGDGVTVVEWPEKMEWLLPEEYLEIKIERTPLDGQDGRRISIAGKGAQYENLEGELAEDESTGS